MPQLTLRQLKQRIQELRPNSRLDYLREQIAGRTVLRAEVKQLASELEQRKEIVARGELPAYSTWEIRREIDARLNTMNVDYELEAMNCVVFDPAAKLIRNMLDYDRREAGGPVQKAREEFQKLRPLMEVEVHRREKALQFDSNIIRSGPWEPNPPHERRRREMIADLEQFKADKEREIANARKVLSRLEAAEKEARYNMEFFRHWVFTGSLEGPQKPDHSSATLATA